MDLRRGVIFVGLAIVSYMLVLAWNEDYGQVRDQEQNSSYEPPTASSPSVALESNTSPADSDSEFTPPEALNTVSPMADQSNPSEIKLETIKVKTDVLDLEIDPVGGNIVSALLPQYKLSLGSDQALPLLESNQRRYYVVESGLFGRHGFDAAKNGPKPVYKSAQSQYVLSDGQDELRVDLVYQDVSGVTVTKRFVFQRNDYVITTEFVINNQSERSWEGNFSGKIVRDRSEDPSSQNSMGMQSYLGMVLSSKEEPYEKIDFEDMLEAPVNRTIQGGWMAFIQHYFLSAWVPDASVPQTYQTRVKNGTYLMGFISPATKVAPGEEASVSARLYLGPKIIERLEQVAPKLDLTVDYGWLFFIAYPLFLLLDFLFGIVGNWGVAIILVTVVVKALFFRLSAASYRSMANMRRVAPKLQSLKDQYGDDRQKMSQAMMDLYRKEKINPLGGCLPILVQMPVFIALYWVLLESVQLRHAPFFFWITDLSIKDPYFVLPILMGASMFIQMQLNPTPPDPMQAKVMKLMPIMMTVFFLWFPAGLVLYWLVNNILSIAQQWVITRQIEKSAAS
ncbi:MAG: membrane protein insertase YidC [Oleiphilus sp.]|nr:MAG: membrane protein insertase YidC [Oleiphilus sp.]